VLPVVVALRSNSMVKSVCERVMASSNHVMGSSRAACFSEKASESPGSKIKFWESESKETKEKTSTSRSEKTEARASSRVLDPIKREYSWTGHDELFEVKSWEYSLANTSTGLDPTFSKYLWTWSDPVRVSVPQISTWKGIHALLFRLSEAPSTKRVLWAKGLEASSSTESSLFELTIRRMWVAGENSVV